MKQLITVLTTVILLCPVLFSQATDAEAADFQNGLFGIWYGGSDLTRPQGLMPITQLDERTIFDQVRGGDWSAQWHGYIKAPHTGEVTFELEVSTGGIVKINGREVIRQWNRAGKAFGKISMVEGRMYPLEVSYRRDGGKPAFSIFWSWPGVSASPVPEDVLFHTSTDIQVSKSRGGFAPAANQLPDVEHILLYQKEGIFAAWPANHGAWIWDNNEILVGFTVGDVEEKTVHHIGDVQSNLLARSKDGGQTWRLLDPPSYTVDSADLKPLDTPINFVEEGFALKVVGTGYDSHHAPAGAFYITQNRGETWQGPYPFTGLAGNETIQQIVDVNLEQWPSKKAASDGWREFDLTPRTDYVIISDSEVLLFLSARPRGRGSLFTDRYFCVRTTNGGLSFDFVSWVVPPGDPHRAVMSQTVHVNDGTMVSVARRRAENSNANWIDAYVTTDGGQSWTLQGRVGDSGGYNGNPPAIVKIDDGRLVCVFGNRSKRAIMVTDSFDNGRTWNEPVALRSGDFRGLYGGQDFGYPRLLKRSDGKLVAIYYWSTEEHPFNISATIWKP
jgi:hypothetical protein